MKTKGFRVKHTRSTQAKKQRLSQRKWDREEISKLTKKEIISGKHSVGKSFRDMEKYGA